MTLTPKEAWFLAGFREDEVMYRRRGRYESAVQSQRLADLFEADPEGARKRIYPWFDRGLDRVPPVIQFPDVIGIGLPNGLWYYMPEDVAFAVWAQLGELLEVSREEFMECAGDRIAGGALMEFMHRAMDTMGWIRANKSETDI